MEKFKLHWNIVSAGRKHFVRSDGHNSELIEKTLNILRYQFAEKNLIRNVQKT